MRNILLELKRRRLITLLICLSVLFVTLPLSSLFLYSKPASADITTDLIAWWRLDESSGTTADDSTLNGKDGTLTGTGGLPEWTTGQINNGLSFDSSLKEYVSTPYNATQYGITRSATFCAWNYPTNLKAQSIISDYNSLKGFSLKYDNSSQMSFYVYPNDYRVTVSRSFSNNTWYHFCGVLDNTTMYVYIDGSSAGSTALGGNVGASVQKIKIGARGDLNVAEFFEGKIDDVRIYDRALSSDDIAELYAYDGNDNVAPEVSAGSDQELDYPSMQATLAGNASDDGLPEGESLVTTWSKLSGPGTVLFDDENSLTATATFGVVGEYVLQLEADDSELQSTDTVSITVPATDNVAPVVSGGLPSGMQDGDTTEVILRADTDENATCKYGTVANTAYDSIANTFSTTGSTEHSQALAVSAGSDHDYYVRCVDEASNENTSDYNISFNINLVEVSDPDFSIVVIPDIQGYSATSAWTSEYNWIVNNKDSQNIQAVIQVGDLTNNSQPAQWTNAETGRNAIEAADLPYLPVIGNHDYDAGNVSGDASRLTTEFDSDYGPDHYDSFSWYGSSSYPEGSNANYYAKFTIGERNIMVLALELYPQTAAVTWADGIISANPDYEVIIVTHGYLLENGTRVTHGGYAGPAHYSLPDANSNSGAELWTNLVRVYPNVRAVICGHMDRNPYTSHLTSVGTNGNSVTQMFQNYQSDDYYETGYDGGGIIGLLTFNDSAQTTSVGYYQTHNGYSVGGLEYDPRYPPYSVSWPPMPLVDSVGIPTSGSESATINWETNVNSSSKVDYGLTDSYGSSTDELDTSPRVSSHSVEVSELSSCTTYHYRVRSKDSATSEVVGGDNTVTTDGCTGSSTVSSQATSQITTASGGTLILQDEGSHGLSLTIPSSFSDSDANFQVHKLNKVSVLGVTSSPSGYSSVGDYFYELKALTNISTSISTFDQPLTVAINYDENEVADANVDGSTLGIFRWDGSNWNQLSNCSTDNATKTATCTTTNFSAFALFGQTMNASDADNPLAISNDNSQGESYQAEGSETEEEGESEFEKIAESIRDNVEDNLESIHQNRWVLILLICSSFLALIILVLMTQRSKKK